MFDKLLGCMIILLGLSLIVFISVVTAKIAGAEESQMDQYPFECWDIKSGYGQHVRVLVDECNDGNLYEYLAQSNDLADACAPYSIDNLADRRIDFNINIPMMTNDGVNAIVYLPLDEFIDAHKSYDKYYDDLSQKNAESVLEAIDGFTLGGSRWDIYNSLIDVRWSIYDSLHTPHWTGTLVGKQYETDCYISVDNSSIMMESE